MNDETVIIDGLKIYLEYDDWTGTWYATDENYDAEWLGPEDGWQGSFRGTGSTKQEALDDLLEYNSAL